MRSAVSVLLIASNLPLLVQGGCSSVRTRVRYGSGVDSAPSDRQAGGHRRSAWPGRGRDLTRDGRRSDRPTRCGRGRCRRGDRLHLLLVEGASRRGGLLAQAGRRRTGDARSDDAAGRVIDVLRHIALLVADEPEFAGAVTSALLGRDPDVEVLRLRIGATSTIAWWPRSDPTAIRM